MLTFRRSHHMKHAYSKAEYLSTVSSHRSTPTPPRTFLRALRQTPRITPSRMSSKVGEIFGEYVESLNFSRAALVAMVAFRGFREFSSWRNCSRSSWRSCSRSSCPNSFLELGVGFVLFRKNIFVKFVSADIKLM